jgi:phage shock protein PspC (stress-responsive transcriptional regulator)
MKNYASGSQEIYLDGEHKKFGGVCAGVARYLDIPRIWVRIIAVVGLVVHPPATLIAYGLAYMILGSSD